MAKCHLKKIRFRITILRAIRILESKVKHFSNGKTLKSNQESIPKSRLNLNIEGIQ